MHVKHIYDSTMTLQCDQVANPQHFNDNFDISSAVCSNKTHHHY
jgi:hypothetical protein